MHIASGTYNSNILIGRSIGVQTFWGLIGQLFFIAMLLYVLELFVDKGTYPRQVKLFEIACAMSGLILLLQYARTHLWAEILRFFPFPVW